jgi:hypothetical protein
MTEKAVYGQTLINKVYVEIPKQVRNDTIFPFCYAEPWTDEDQARFSINFFDAMAIFLMRLY